MARNMFLLVLCIFVTGIAGLDCPFPYVELITGCHFFSGAGGANWWEATELCQRIGGYLSVPENFLENQAIKDYVVYNFPGQSYWMGAYDLGHEGEWHYALSGRKLGKFNDWGDDEPNNDHGIENCLTMSLKKDGDTKWDDRPCDTRYSYVCTKLNCPSCK